MVILKLLLGKFIHLRSHYLSYLGYKLLENAPKIESII